MQKKQSVSWKRRMWFWAASGTIFYAALVGGMYAAQRALMYFPSKDIAAPTTYNLADMQDLTLKASDGIQVQAWVRAPKPDMPLIVYFHGNAGNLAHRAAEYRLWLDEGFGLIALSYRGYAKSEGNPTEQGIYMDARAAVEYAQKTLHIPDSKIVLYGESLGTGIAVQMATEYALGALILEAPYTATSDRAAELYPYLPVRTIMKDQFLSREKIGSVHMPVQIFHGEKDNVIPVAHGRRMLELANEPKEGNFYPDVHHVDFDIQEQLVQMLAFLRKHGVM
jgi:fermentation-respiration switch protein FrsA (DUF1100 family)